MSRTDYQCSFNLQDCLKTLGLDEKGRVQQAVDSAFLMGCEPYVPKDQGYLIDSGRIEEPGLIVYGVENKARRLYYGEFDWNWSKGGVQAGGLRGPYWADRYFQNGGKKELEQVARNEVGK